MHSWLVAAKYAVRNAGDSTGASTRQGLRLLGNRIHINQGSASAQEVAGYVLCPKALAGTPPSMPAPGGPQRPVSLCRVAARAADHDLWAYDEALRSIREGGVMRVPASTRDLHGIAAGSVKGSLART